MLLTGLLMMQSMTAEIHALSWQQKVSPLLCRQMQTAKAKTRNAPGSDTYLGALVKLKEGQNGYLLSKEGTLLLDSLNQIYVALLPASKIEVLASNENVLAIEANEAPIIQMDRTHVTIGADKIHAGTPAHNIPAYTGKGVLVGITDIGFDYTHPMFRNADGTLAIKKVWDAFATNSNGFGGIGAIYDTQDAILKAQSSQDNSCSHGTHVMGIAAGRAWKAKNSAQEEITYKGIAYEADILSAAIDLDTGIPEVDDAMGKKVKNILKEGAAGELLNLGVTTNNIISALGIKMIFDYAKEHNMPCVINCSWNLTPNLTENYKTVDEFLSGLMGPGRIIVGCAGNWGDQGLYTEKPNDQKKWQPYMNLKDSLTSFSLHSDDEFTLALSLYANQTDTKPEFYMDEPLTSQEMRAMVDKDPETSYYAWEYKDKQGNKKYITLSFGYRKNDKQGYDYMFTLDIPSEYYDDFAYPKLELTSDSKIRLLGSPYKILFDKQLTGSYPYTSGWPATASHTISVGLTSHRNKFTNIEGKETSANSNKNQEGYIVHWSSCGPTLDERTKPDVTAPGYNIISARSKFYEGNAKEWKDDNPLVVARADFEGETREVVAMCGTSMAAPMVTGIVALWLQAKPTLTREQIMETISRTAKKPQADLEYPNSVYGYGEVDAYAGLLDILGINTAIPSLSTKQAAISMKGNTLYIEGTTEPVDIRVYNLGGQLVFIGVATDGTLALPNLPAAVYAVQAGNIGSQLIRF